MNDDAKLIRRYAPHAASEALPQPLVPAEVDLLDPCTCLRDGKHCRVCRLWEVPA